MNIVIFGGSGFIGGALARKLAARGHHLTLPVRDREKAKELIVLPNTDVAAFDPSAMRGAASALAGADAVINLVGILNERSGGEFVRVHSEFTRVLCDTCASQKARRLVHISALNAGAGAPSEYLRSKGKAEQAIRAAAVRHVIIRPSVVIGPGDSLINMFARLARLSPVLLLPCASLMVQPIAIDDLTEVIAHAAESGDEDGKTLSAAGPEKMLLAEVARRTIAAAGMRRPVVGLGPSLSYCLGALTEALPGVHFFSRDNCLSARIPTTVGGENDARRIVGELTSLDAVLARMFEGAPPPARRRR